ncbi:MAG: hypothetical protein ABH812_03120 [bacterium]
MNEIREGVLMQDIRTFVETNNYLVENEVLSRCIDGRYIGEDGLPVLAIPGADIGQVGMLFAAANESGVKLDPEKAFSALVDTVGGVENIRIHTDSHNKDGIAAGCGYFGQIKRKPWLFGITIDQVDIIEQGFEKLVEQGANQIVLEGDHQEEGVLIVRGDRSVKPNGKYFIHHDTLIDKRNKLLITSLQKNDQFLNRKFVDELAEIPVRHLRKIIEILTKRKEMPRGLSFHGIDFKADGTFDVVVPQKWSV